MNKTKLLQAIHSLNVAVKSGKEEQIFIRAGQFVQI